MARRHPDGSSAGKVSWRVFTHKKKGDEVVRLYARRKWPGPFVRLGAVASEDKISCQLDAAGGLHVLYLCADQQAGGAYVREFVSFYGMASRIGFYRPAQGPRVPQLVTSVFVEHGREVRPRPERPEHIKKLMEQSRKAALEKAKAIQKEKDERNATKTPGQ